MRRSAADAPERNTGGPGRCSWCLHPKGAQRTQQVLDGQSTRSVAAQTPYGESAGRRYASALIANGQSVLVMQSMLGHSSATEILDLYGHLFPDAEGNARTAMDVTINRRPAAPRLTQ